METPQNRNFVLRGGKRDFVAAMADDLRRILCITSTRRVRYRVKVLTGLQHSPRTIPAAVQSTAHVAGN